MQKEILLFMCLTLIVLCATGKLYLGFDGYLCVRPQFTETTSPSNLNRIDCASQCEMRPNCQAFTINDGPCQLFVFDKCSKSVRDCSCSRRGQVFVKQQPGLEPGKLCPSGYGDDLCGAKYKLYSGMTLWWTGKQKCESESGQVIMADVTDAAEMAHIDTQIFFRRTNNSFWLGGRQLPGSAEPAGGWHWVGCNGTISPSLWAPSEPNNYNGENVVGRIQSPAMLSDIFDNASLTTGLWGPAYIPNLVLCECVSPFD